MVPDPPATNILMTPSPTLVAHHSATADPAASVATSNAAVVPNNARHGSATCLTLSAPGIRK